jgi:hypothetical protein
MEGEAVCRRRLLVGRTCLLEIRCAVVVPIVVALIALWVEIFR